ncbi:2-amino-4-hydroxy-6-hydroxymethyldihydropteridine diphosphokinase [Caenispirillum bisanense]|uniref:2-amino-4-hydroxy-6-hydroxymethyldihydropteridine pyrophosphokinase n=1 Tax=Caenispirillum bisanense TaxID=414052 RepID=A0A286GFQ0_9PROT|nr:2-amino-4-hydroxy-6-hydroxymethyldihydropteridine diphosphokinase [Caenispirillum bisanense]SOD94351.1 2-amino-4-hydroxy-6-hydroxymethyldihydropteridinediphosphokinase [Caenispirillum bisanense]
MTPDRPILVALGANLPSRFGGPMDTLRAALAALSERGVAVAACSAFYRTPPWPPGSDQPDYVNAVARVTTALGPVELLACLHSVEADFGRVRSVANAARPLDLDLVAHGAVVMDGNVVVPHPRLADRAFVLLPLRDVAPDWVDPRTGRALPDLLAALPRADVESCERLSDAPAGLVKAP